MELDKLELTYLIAQQKPISNQLLSRYIESKSENNFNLILNLICDSKINYIDYYQLQSYITYLANQYFSLYHIYTPIEQQWLILLAILKVYDIRKAHTDIIRNKYKHLPPLHVHNDFIKWIKDEMYRYIYPYFVEIHTDHNSLIEEINSILKE